MVRTLIFTDLDGTLLDDRYDITGAAKAMDLAYEHGAVVIPVSSKTHAEMSLLRRQQQIATPFVFENGAGIDWGEQQRWAPDQAVVPRGLHIYGLAYADLCELLVSLRTAHGLNFVGFNELRREQIVQLTNLSPDGAGLAQQRMASEPLIGLENADELRVLRQALSQRGLLLQKGGRFYTVTSAREKSHAVNEILTALNHSSCTANKIIACGDSANDLSMLALADIALLFSGASGGGADQHGASENAVTMQQYLRDLEAAPRIVLVPGAGHVLWSAAITKLLQP